MLQNPCKILAFKKNVVYKIPLGGGEVSHIQPVAYSRLFIAALWSPAGKKVDLLALVCDV